MTIESVITSAFRPVADAAGTAFVPESPSTVAISKNGYTLRIAHRPERVEGTYVTLQRDGSPEYALVHLVRFKAAPAERDAEAAAVLRGEMTELARLAMKYAVPYLLGLRDDFAEFEASAVSAVRSQRTDSMDFTANKWVRPEW